MYSFSSIILAVIATIINSIIFGYVASNSKSNKISHAYLIFLTFTALYIIFDCIIIQAFNSIGIKDIIVKIQALFWMPLATLFLNFTYLFLKKQKDKAFYFFITGTITSLFITVFSDKVLLGFKEFNFGTEAFTGPWFLPISFIVIMPQAVHALYLIGIDGRVFNLGKNEKLDKSEPYLALQLRILFFGSVVCLIIAITTNIILDEFLGYSGNAHLASLSMSIQSIFLLPAIVKYNFLNQPMETLGDELYLNSSDAVLITGEDGIIINLNQSARNLFNLIGPVVNKNIIELFYTDYNFFSKENNVETKTKTGYYVSVSQNTITRGNLSLGNIFVIRDITESKKTEENIIKSEKAYRNLIETSPDGISIHDFENIFFINKSGADIIGEKSENLINKPFIQYIHPRDIDKLKDIIAKLNRNKKVRRFEMTVVRKNGSERTIEVIGFHTTHEGKPAMLTFLRDRTERIKVENDMKSSQASLAEAQKMNKIGSFQYNLKSDKVVWSEALYNIYGLDQKTYKPTNNNFLNVVVHPDDRQYVKELVDNATNNNVNSLDYFHKIVHSDGTEKIMHALAEIIYDGSGQALIMNGSAQDVTELYNTQMQLEESERRLQKAQELAQLGNWEENHQTGEIYWSSELRKIFGLNKTKKILPRLFWKYLHPDDLDWMKTSWFQAEKTMVPYRGIFRIKLKNGTIKHLSEQAEFMQDSQGNLIKTIGTVHDVTQIREYQEKLKNLSSHLQNLQEEERSRIAREIHDELGQNLTSINMDIDYLKSRGVGKTDSDLLKRLNTLGKLVNHTIKTTRKISQELRPSILDDLGLKSAIEWQVSQYKKRSDSIYKLNMIGDDENISTEQSTAIFRIAQESLTNIARHAEATNVEISLSIQKLFIKLEIKDDGKGISENNTQNHGASFGLFGMKERASILGGELDIVSAPKEGTAIIVELPLQAN